MDAGGLSGSCVVQVILNTLLEERGELSLEYVRCAPDCQPSVMLGTTMATDTQSLVTYVSSSCMAGGRRLGVATDPHMFQSVAWVDAQAKGQLSFIPTLSLTMLCLPGSWTTMRSRRS